MSSYYCQNCGELTGMYGHMYGGPGYRCTKPNPERGKYIESVMAMHDRNDSCPDANDDEAHFRNILYYAQKEFDEGYRIT